MNSFRSSFPLKSPHLDRNKFAAFPFSQGTTSLPQTLLALVRSRLYLCISAFAFTTLLLLTYTTVPTFRSSSNTVTFPSNGLKRELWEHLNQIKWREIVLEPTEVPFVKQSDMSDHVPWLQEDLFPKGEKGKNNNKKNPDGTESLPKPPRHRIDVLPRKVVVPVGATSPSRMIFGIVTTVDRAKMMSQLWTRWITPPAGEDTEENRPSCLVLLSAEETQEDVDGLAKSFKARGVNCGLRRGKYERYEVRVLSMIREFRDYADELGKTFDWYVFNDDDTFWVDLRTLRRMLAKYDITQDFFVGATTEAKNQLESFGRMAFGGAGMLVTDSLSRKMYDLFDDCYEKYRHIFGGDEMLTRCAALATGLTKATVTSEEKGLHQFDIPGDTTGVLQSGIPFLNLHHYIGGSWVHLFGYGSYRTDFSQILLLKRVMEFIGGDNMFKRYVFGEGRWLLTQGYSLTIFEEPLKPAQLAKMEHTWYEGYRLSFPDRPPVAERHDWDGSKVKQTFYIDDIKVISPQTAVMTYVMADKWDEHLTSAERVRLEVLWDGCWNGGPGCDRSELRAAALV
ncbi:hypothetical protein T439DRAFT_354176 [Meredithblackwellia eburnea MCA 4105]